MTDTSELQGTTPDASQQAGDAPQEKKSPVDALMGTISGIMLPVMGALVGCGMVSCIVTIGTTFGLLDTSSGTYMIFYGISQTFFYFMPIIVGASAAKYFGMDIYLGAIIGACMIYPTFVEAAGAGTTVSFLGIVPVTFNDYTSTVFPAIIAVWFASVLYHFFSKHIPEMVSFFCVPMLVILIDVPLALTVIGPVVNALSNALSSLTLTIFNFSPVLCAILLGATWILFIVPMGLHWGFMVVFMNNLALTGSEPIMGVVCDNLALCGTLVAVGIKAKTTKTRSVAFSTALTNFFGISEPGLFGVVLQHKETIATTAIGSAIAAVIPAVMGTAVYNLTGTSGIFSLLMYIDPSGNPMSFVGAVLCNVVGFALCFALTMVAKFDPDLPEEAETSAPEASEAPEVPEAPIQQSS